jgi:hypothetical protein
MHYYANIEHCSVFMEERMLNNGIVRFPDLPDFRNPPQPASGHAMSRQVSFKCKRWRWPRFPGHCGWSCRQTIQEWVWWGGDGWHQIIKIPTPHCQRSLLIPWEQQRMWWQRNLGDWNPAVIIPIVCCDWGLTYAHTYANLYIYLEELYHKHYINFSHRLVSRLMYGLWFK